MCIEFAPVKSARMHENAFMARLRNKLTGIGTNIRPKLAMHQQFLLSKKLEIVSTCNH
jgi:hypothetical protein